MPPSRMPRIWGVMVLVGLLVAVGAYTVGSANNDSSGGAEGIRVVAGFFVLGALALVTIGILLIFIAGFRQTYSNHHHAKPSSLEPSDPPSPNSSL